MFMENSSPIRTWILPIIYFIPSGTKTDYSDRNVNGKRVFDANGLQFAFKHLFPKEGENITADLNYFSGKNQQQFLNEYRLPDRTARIGCSLQPAATGDRERLQ